VEAEVDPRRALEEQRQERAVHADADLEEPVGPDEVADPSGQAREDEAAEREAGHERREHGDDGVDGVAEDEAEHPEPDHLVDEPGGAGQEEAHEHDAEAAPEGRGSGRRGTGHLDDLLGSG
jgi:hypothetical protein